MTDGDPLRYHVGLMTDAEILAALTGPPQRRRIPYAPDDPKPCDQRPYLAYAQKREGSQ